VLLLWYVLRQTDVAGAFRLLENSDIGLFVLMLLSYTGSKLLAAYRLYVLLRCGEPDTRMWPVIRITFLSNFLAIFLPGGGGELVRVAALKHSGLKLALSFSSVVLDRLLGFGALGVLLLVGALFSTDIGFPAETEYVAIGIALLLLGSFIVIHPAIHRLLLRLAPIHSRRNRILTALIETVDLFKKRPQTMVWAFFLAMLMQLFRVVFFYLGILTLGVSVPIISMFILVPAFVLLTTLPVSVGGVGVREVLFLTFFSSLNLPGNIAVALALLMYIGNFIASLPGMWFALQFGLAPVPNEPESRSAGVAETT